MITLTDWDMEQPNCSLPPNINNNQTVNAVLQAFMFEAMKSKHNLSLPLGVDVLKAASK